MKKIFKVTGITLAVIVAILLIMMCLPLVFKGKFAEIVKSTANKSLKTELNYSDLEVSFFRHFPNLTITLRDFTLKSSAPFDKDTLVSAREISFGLNLPSVIKGPLKITKVYINRGKFILQYNEKGASNFDVYNSSADTTENPAEPGEGTASVKIEKIIFVKTDFIYSDPSLPMRLIAHGFNYSGQSELDKNVLKLNSRINIDSLDLYYNNVRYLKSKPAKAQLITLINLSSLNIKFQKNNFVIKDIPFEFKGELNFRKTGYMFFLSLFSQSGEEYLSGSVMMVSTKTLWLSAKADVNINLENWTRGFGLQDASLKGMFSMKLKAQGEYASGQNPASRKPDTVILSIPDFSLNARLNEGYFRYTGLPEAITGISLSLQASSKEHDYNSISFSLDSLKASFLKNRMEGYFRLKGLLDYPLEAGISTKINLGELKKVVPLDSLELKGLLDMDLKVKGNYAPEKKLFPVCNLRLNLTEGEVKTKYYPRPVEKINLMALVTNTTGKISGTYVKIDPFSFSFEGNPFELRGDVNNPDNVRYAVRCKGSVDVASIYKVFAQQGMDLKGFIEAGLNLKGTQSDALAGRYEKLNNSGQLVLQDIAITSEYLPKPLVVKSGVFRFENDKIWFEKFDGRYGASDITLNGYLSNVINYVLADQPLKGSFSLKSNYLLADEFISEEEPTPGPQSPSSQLPTPNSQPGVIVVPPNLEIGLKADIKKLGFRKLTARDLSTNVEVQKGILLLKSLNFELIGCKVAMEATYGSLTPTKAFFDFHVKAENFDVKRAYNEVEMFRKLSTAAGKCEGIISLDYTLKGKIGGNMNPVYPSLEGGGVVSLKKIKVYGLKLFTSMSKNLDKEKIKSPDLAKVDIKTSIKKNVITLEKTKMKMAGFRFRIEGETNFNGQINFKARLGLPPLGIVGIPMRILGTQDNPKFKYGRGNSDEAVEETEYSDEIPPEMLQKIKNAKEEDIPDEPEK